MRTLVVTVLCVISSTLLFCQQQKPKTPAPLATGSLVDNVYRNPQLGITYKIVLGWVDRTSQPQAEPDKPTGGQVLLAAFEHPPEVTGDSVNSAVLIAAESISFYPGVKTAADYFSLLTEATASQGFKVVNEPYEFTLGNRSLVRSDFSKEVGKLTMHQSSLVILSKGYAVSFTFIGGSEDEVEELVRHLSFATTAK